MLLQVVEAWLLRLVVVDVKSEHLLYAVDRSRLN